MQFFLKRDEGEGVGTCTLCPLLDLPLHGHAMTHENHIILQVLDNSGKCMLTTIIWCDHGENCSFC